jgi:hypothetical protein
LSPPPAGERDVALEAPAGEAVLSLAESPTTGYLWRIVDLPPEVEVVDSAFTPSTAGGFGRGGERRFTLRARAPGVLTFSAESARGDEPADERVRVTLRVGQPWGGG